MKRVSIVVCVAAGLTLPLSARAAIIEVSHPFDKYGHLRNDTIDGHGGCAATSFINSFKYLQTAHPRVYDDKLVPKLDRNNIANDWDNDDIVTANDDMLAARSALHKKIWGHNPQAADGSKYAWEEKLKWFDDHGLGGTTVFAGMTTEDTTGWFKKEFLKGGRAPTWDFLWTEIAHCEDVEIGFVGHMVTLTSLKFDDKDGDRKWDPDPDPNKYEKAWIDYIDPNSPFGPDTNNPGPTLSEIEWKKYPGTEVVMPFAKDAGYGGWIYYAYSESPVPEPATLIVWSLLGAWGVGLGWWRRRRRA
jgi:hypothetical protein